jgi:hypothetical protein
MLRQAGHPAEKAMEGKRHRWTFVATFPSVSVEQHRHDTREVGCCERRAAGRVVEAKPSDLANLLDKPSGLKAADQSAGLGFAAAKRHAIEESLLGKQAAAIAELAATRATKRPRHPRSLPEATFPPTVALLDALLFRI